MANILERLTEGTVFHDKKKETVALLKKWEGSGLLEGIEDDYQRSSMAILLENQAKELLREANTMAGGDVQGFASVAFPIVRRVFAGLIANDLVSVQPMSLPNGLIFFMDFQYGRNTSIGLTNDVVAEKSGSLFGDRLGKDIKDGIRVDGNDYASLGFRSLTSGYGTARLTVNLSGSNFRAVAASVATTEISGANGATFGVCTLTNPPSITMLTRTFRYNNYDYVLPCPIGYENNSPTDTRCYSTGNYKKVNLILEGIPNPTTQRMKLELNKYLYINLNDEVQINYFTFTTGASSARPTGWVLEGSMSGNPSNADEWILLHSSSGYTYSEAGTVYSFIQTSCFPILTAGPPIPPSTPSVGSGLGYDFTNDPSSGTSIETRENFKNPTKSLLRDSLEPVFEVQSAPKLESNYNLPLQTGVVPKYTIPERRIQYLRFRVTETRKENSPFVHMSMLQFITPLGPLPKDMYTISNPMGVHPNSKTGPAALGSPTERWVNLNRNPLLIKFGILPPTVIQGFQFSIPSSVKNSEDGVPSQWLIESSYDGRFWELFEQTEGRMIFSGQTSPVYVFGKQI